MGTYNYKRCPYGKIVKTTTILTDDFGYIEKI